LPSARSANLAIREANDLIGEQLWFSQCCTPDLLPLSGSFLKKKPPGGRQARVNEWEDRAKEVRSGSGAGAFILCGANFHAF